VDDGVDVCVHVAVDAYVYVVAGSMSMSMSMSRAMSMSMSMCMCMSMSMWILGGCYVDGDVHVHVDVPAYVYGVAACMSMCVSGWI
jgi:hypothetical protein